MQVLEVLRRRIEDPIEGIPDSVVTRQGDDRILVQIPGGQLDRTRARDMLKVTGFLEFKIVRDTAQTEELLRAKHPDGLPPDTEIAFERDKESQRVLAAYLVPETADLTGDYLEDARVGFDNRQRPIVAVPVQSGGRRAVPEAHRRAHRRAARDRARRPRLQRAGGPLADRLARPDRGPLQLGGGGRPRRRAALGLALAAGGDRGGAHGGPGPGGGLDRARASARRSRASSLVLGFMLLYYRFSGVYAGIALVLNLTMLIGLMTMFGATLTLPGLGAFVLTIGMAVDANVLIFERIREELRAGKTPRGAIGAGFSKAFWAIVDSNITTIGTALVLYEYGTGPIKGFAVALSIGIVTSVFAALAITRVLFDLYPGDRHVETLSI